MNQVQNEKAAILGLQHLLAMYAGAVAVPLLIGMGLGFDEAQMTYLISIDIFMCGVATLLQLTVTKFFGIGLPVVLGCAIQAVSPLIIIGSKNGVGAIYGSIIAAGIYVVLIAGLFSKVKVLFPPIVTGTVITVIGLTLIPVAITKMGGGDASAKTFGDPASLIQAAVTILLILGLQAFAKGFLRSISVLIGLVGGTILACLMGNVSFSAISHAPIFHVPQPFYFGMPKFDVWSILLMIIISTISMVESTGVYFALGDITGKNIGEEDLKLGYRAEGLAVILGGIFNTFPYTGFSQNVGLVQLSGIKSTRPIYFSAFFLIILGLFPKVGAVAQIIPEPVLGGGMLVMFGMVAVQGMRMLSKVNFEDDKNLLIVALSIGLGLGFNSLPTLF
ncbi:MAG: purine permease, partial [Enterococcus cecorum]|nr:purine permease [Enterococcus cecorum]